MPHDFLVNRTDLAQTEMLSSTPLVPGAGEAVLQIERFALTANNITYGVAGDLIGYWQFFPSTPPLGRIPVWGIGTVSASQADNIEVGQRFYGYFPMSSELLVTPDRVSPRGFTDSSAHRAELPVVYNQYSLVNADNGFDAAFDNHAMLYRPLFTTSFVLDDYLADNQFFGAQNIVLGSASSKTAFGLAFMLQQRPEVTVTGLTSAGNVAFTESLGLYDSVLTYDQVESLPKVETAYVDMAGNRQVLARVHNHLADLLVNSCGVGITHWDARDGEDPQHLPGAKPSMFFAPSQIVKRNEELGPAEYHARISAATQAFFARVDEWVHIVEQPFSKVDDVYHTVLAGPAPDQGYIVVAD